MMERCNFYNGITKGSRQECEDRDKAGGTLSFQFDPVLQPCSASASVTVLNQQLNSELNPRGEQQPAADWLDLSALKTFDCICPRWGPALSRSEPAQGAVPLQRRSVQ